MASPFPGMDPFLEHPAYWPDFHSRFINYWCEAIADALPPQYEASLSERVYLIEHEPEARKLGYPDIAVTEGAARSPASLASGAAVATLEPVTVPLGNLEGPTETYIEILHQPDRSLVTALELLSPSNKSYPCRAAYLEKRRALLYQYVHLVELDLLLDGHRMSMGKPLPPADYYYLVSRAEQRPDCQVYYWTLSQVLPKVPVPLRSPDPDLVIDLAAVLATAYERGRFGRRIDYRVALPPTLHGSDPRWLADILSSWSKG